MHGGRAVKGAAHPNFKTGLYSKHMPTRVAAAFDEAMADPDLISHRRAVAMLSVRSTELIKRLHSGESGSLWADLSEAWGDFQSAQKRAADATANDDAVSRQLAANDAQSALGRIGKIITAGGKDEAVWHELIETIDKGSQIVTREQGRLRDLHQMMTAEQVMLLFNGIYQAVVEEVTDRAVQGRIGEKLGRFLNLGGGRNASNVVDAGIPLPPDAKP